MKSQRGSKTDRLRRLFSGGLGKVAADKGVGPHIEIPAQDPPARDETVDPRDRLRATFERWTRLDAPLPEALIRRGLVALRADRDALGVLALDAEAGYREIRIHETTHFSVDVLVWRSGRFGPIQEHGDAARGLLVVEGTATEIHFEQSPCGRLAPVRSHPTPPGAVSIARDGDIRSIGNLQAPGEDLIALLVTSPAGRSGRRRDLSETIFGDLDTGD